MGQVAPVLPELLRRQLAHVGQALLNQLLGKFIGLFKIIRAVKKPVVPIEAKPVNVLLNCLYVLCILFGGVGIVHPQVANSAVFFSRAKIDDQRFTVADMKIPVRLRWKPGVDLPSGKLSAFGQIFLYKGVDKIFIFRALCHMQHPLSENLGTQ